MALTLALIGQQIQEAMEEELQEKEEKIKALTEEKQCSNNWN